MEEAFSKTKKRIQYIDALRGVLIFLVVFWHVEYYGAQVTSTILVDCLKPFRMPMFFFVSGYMASRSEKLFDANHTAMSIAKKAMSLLLPTLIFWALYVVIVIGDTNVLSIQHWPAGYWFTLALFEVLWIYYNVLCVSHYTHKRVVDVVLAAIAVWTTFCLLINWTMPQMINEKLIAGVQRHLPFFILGTFCRRYQKTFLKVVNHEVLKGVATVALLGLLVFYIQHDFGKDFSTLKTAVGLVISLCSIAVVFSWFHNHGALFESRTRAVRCLCFIGTRTLDIYVLHYFFIPKLPFLTHYLRQGANTAVELVAVGAVSVVVILMCLAVSSVVRNSKVLGHYLFRAKIKH